MRCELLLPELGLGDVSITVSKWLVEPKSRIVESDRLLEVLAGSVTVDLPAPASGILWLTLVSPGERLNVGQRLAVIECDEQDEEEDTA